MTKLQSDSFKSSTEAGGISNLPNVDKVYLTGNSMNKILATAIDDNDFSTDFVTNASGNYYSVSSSKTISTIVHTADIGCMYDLPAAVAGKKFTFVYTGGSNTNGTNVVIDGSNNKIDFYTTANAASVTATVGSGTYTNGSSGTAGTLGAAIKTAMEAVDTGSTYTITYTSEKIYTVARSANTFYFQFATGSNAAYSTRIAMGYLPFDGSAAASQTGEINILNMIFIRPASGDAIFYKGQLCENPGFLKIQNKGIAVHLRALDSTNWVAEQEVTSFKDKGGELQDISLVGRNSWVSKTALATARGRLASFSLNGYGYIAGGYTGSVSNLVDQYNDSANTWTAKTAYSSTARYGSAGFSLNGYGYIASGGSTVSYSNLVDQYNDSANTWTARTAFSSTARRDLPGFSLNGYGYIAGGYTGSVSNLVDQYNDSANTWTAKTAIATGRSTPSSFSLNGYGYIAGGWTGSYVSLTDQYNDSANIWTPRTGFATGRYDTASFSLNGYGYIAGGFTGTVDVSLTDQYNDSANTWTAKTTYSSTARRGLAGFSLNGYGYIAGGYIVSGYNLVDQYN